MILPKQITIFGNTIDIIEVDCLNEASGDFSPVTNTIHVARHTLSDGIKCELSPKQKEQTFWHEVFHAFQYYSTGRYDEAQSQVYAGFMSELDIELVVGKTKTETDAVDDCGAVPAEEYGYYDKALSGLKQQIERGDKEALCLVKKMKDDAIKYNDPDFAIAIDRMLYKYYNKQTK